MVIFLNENLMVSEAYLVKFDQLMTQQMFFWDNTHKQITQ